jgi:flagellar basal-body rod protein FlgC
MGIFRVEEPTLTRRLFAGIDAAASGLTAQRLRMDVIAENIANVNTTRTPEGGPYKRKRVIFSTQQPTPFFTIPFLTNKRPTPLPGGVRVVAIEEDPSPPRIEYRPGHPDADKDGYLRVPNINIVTEMTDMISATRAYEANVSTIRASRTIMMRAIRIGEGR